EWTPVKFRYPSIDACVQRLADVRPIPYRPFKYGPYHVTMGLRSMSWSDWIEARASLYFSGLDQGHERYYKIKAHRLKIRTGVGSPVRIISDAANPVVRGGALAAVELVHELAEYLSRRYPGEFTITRHTKRPVVSASASSDATFGDWGWDDLPPVKTITMTSIGVSFDVPLSVADGERAAERAMEIAGLLIQDDLALMIEGNDGKYYFQAGSISLAGFWRMQDKIGMPLDEIHLSGHVPQYEEKLAMSLERFFRKLAVDKPMVRNNYFFQMTPEDKAGEIDAEELGWADSMMGPEDEYKSSGGHRSIDKPSGTEAEVDVGLVQMRSERQTVRRLGRSGAVAFTIRTYLTRVKALGEEAGVAGRLASALRSWPVDVGEYKGQFRGGWHGAVVAYMDGMTQSPDGEASNSTK
ncbi:hypothetical protein BDN70DRAFT_954212, partial [Pholiota conissans]